MRCTDCEAVSVKVVVASDTGVDAAVLVEAVSHTRVLWCDGERIPVRAPISGWSGFTLCYGRLRLADVVVHLFGTRGAQRSEPVWQEAVRGAVGVVVAADAERITESTEAVALAERNGLPFVVVVHSSEYSVDADAARAVLDVDADVPVLVGDVAEARVVLEALRALVGRAVALAPPTGGVEVA